MMIKLMIKMMIKMMIKYITYLINIFPGSLVNGKFLNLKSNAFIITGFVCSSKYVKQTVLINHRWITPTLQKR